MKLKRIKHACCGMEDGRIYEAQGDNTYASVLLPNGEWTASHWVPGFFEVIEENQNERETETSQTKSA